MIYGRRYATSPSRHDPRQGRSGQQTCRHRQSRHSRRREQQQNEPERSRRIGAHCSAGDPATLSRAKVALERDERKRHGRQHRGQQEEEQKRIGEGGKVRCFPKRGHGGGGGQQRHGKGAQGQMAWTEHEGRNGFLVKDCIGRQGVFHGAFPSMVRHYSKSAMTLPQSDDGGKGIQKL